MIRKNKKKPKTGCHQLGILPKAPMVFATACLLGGELSAQTPIDVNPNARLRDILYDSTDPNNKFNLLGDVTLDATFTINADRYNNIEIFGNGHTITRTAQNNVFWIHRSGMTLTIQDAIITTSATGGNTWGAISIEVGYSPAVVNLNNTTIRGNRSYGSPYSAGLTAFSSTTVNGNVTFENNHGIGDGAGATSVRNSGISLRYTGEVTFTNNTAENRSGAAAVHPNASLTFDNKVRFEGNNATIRAGALWVDNNALATFKDETTFDGNYSGRHGGAINIEYGAGRVVFEQDVNFFNNYARGSNSAGPRGGAVAIGIGSGTIATPQLEISGTAIFDRNYVWAEGTGTNNNSYGGAIAMTAVDNPMTSNGNLNASHVYRVKIEQGIFTNNYAYSQAPGKGYGGAIFSKNHQSELSFGSGSEFRGNAATGKGGAIYFSQGTINLDGDVTFEGNRQDATFTAPETGAPILNENSGTANAIYFTEVNNQNQTATLNMVTSRVPVPGQPGQTVAQQINFNDPIESAAGRSVFVHHSGDGEVIFSRHNSDILAQTVFDGGSFILKDGAQYGRTGTEQNSSLHMGENTTLRGGDQSVIRASKFTLEGRIESLEGIFYLQGADINLTDTSVVAINIFGDGSNSSIDAGGHAIKLNGAELEVTADRNYVPSQELSDRFTIVANLSEEPVTFFEGDGIVMINYATFTIVYGENSIYLQQLTVPEPSTYALLLAVGCVGFAWARRQKKNRKTILA